ncbi:peptidyl-tRNA hydrolase [Nemania sp. FL0916]|nr:peptidyl-tRNA hydrolase [Nemania sp. FL0916]
MTVLPPVLRVLVISLGNQGGYYDCLHSAGHFAIAAAQKVLAPSQPNFKSERYGKMKCKVSSAVPYTFIQSPTMMNICGNWVVATWRDMLERHELLPSELGLVVVHDELESEFGRVRPRDWDASHRGHNGIKSIKKSSTSFNDSRRRWARISVGIGRPLGRTSDVVSDYVLRKLTSHQIQTINDEVGPKVVDCLHQLHEKM